MSPEMTTLAVEFVGKAAAEVDGENSDGSNPSVGKCTLETNCTVESGA